MGKQHRVLGALGLLALTSTLFAGGRIAHATPPAGLAGLLKDGLLQWGADTTDGAPYVFYDPKNPKQIIGFEVDIANEMARRLHVQQKMVQTTWDTLPQALLHRRFDLVMNGLEITPDRQKVLLFSKPYFVYSEQVVVRKDNTTIHGFADLPGHTVGTGTSFKSDQIIKDYNSSHSKKIILKEYETDLPFQDLAAGRLDAIFIDLPIAAYYALPPIETRLKLVGTPTNPGYYGMAFRPANTQLAAQINATIAAMIKDGTLGRIYRHWNLYSSSQVRIGIR